MDLQITDPTVPSQLLDNANRWLRSFQDEPARNAVPYSVTLAPLTIAEGPLPPNTADIEHAQDVLVLCAKKRSQILDQINLLSFILAHQNSYDWTGDPTPTPASVDASLNGLEMDLDLVAECASLAINHPADAVTPAKFALNMGQTFPAGMLPSLPQPKPIEAVAPQIPQTTVTLSQMYWTRTSPWREPPSKIWDCKFRRLFKRCRACFLTLSASRNLISAALCH